MLLVRYWPVFQALDPSARQEKTCLRVWFVRERLYEAERFTPASLPQAWHTSRQFKGAGVGARFNGCHLRRLSVKPCSISRVVSTVLFVVSKVIKKILNILAIFSLQYVKCEQCDYVTVTSCRLKMHVRAKHEADVTCEICGKIVKTDAYVLPHNLWRFARCRTVMYNYVSLYYDKL